ncbi:hypothetical protein ATORI0001_0900 [Lancefieldella rimae ATCC 49626]|uniref:Uncharacterized protein n=1 Tax=Lancefieldella rimae (strain ATCC 49626 / DSM 7090 / CCUG 31168 / NBRC 15546 / VPI D140H-11A) TaxID=553184 RepID=B9CMU1_LANR4|nr:hypothetical protein ATORI0001_0900 [Lancefieldella rimae ATCC 49626]
MSCYLDVNFLVILLQLNVPILSPASMKKRNFWNSSETSLYITPTLMHIS